jgi:hypothetical protein
MQQDFHNAIIYLGAVSASSVGLLVLFIFTV